MNNFSTGITQNNPPLNVTSSTIPFKELGYFAKIIIDYLDESDQLKDFYEYPVSFDGIAQALIRRKEYKTDRQTLVEGLNLQYKEIKLSASVETNIHRLKEETTFTVTTAHQPNIFTGYLYFIYKILHTIKLTASLNKKFPGNHFVPVFYMGSEDADLEELGKIFLDGEKLEWKTEQKGAVGRMETKGLEKIIERIEWEIAVLPFGRQLTAIIKSAYTSSANIQTATLKLVNELFAEYGLVILIPDSPVLKKVMHQVFLDDLINQQASEIVENTIKDLSAFYKVQANPREINLFYLKDNIRERIVRKGNEWKVIGTSISFTEQSLTSELELHPERFSPNVILRGLFQETILPNLVFIGGGGELAYWLELKSLFKHYQVPFPVLMLRNSFLIIEEKWNDKIRKLGFDEKQILKNENQLTEELVKRDSLQKLQLNEEIGSIEEIYSKIKSLSNNIDKSLDLHVESLKTQTVNSIKNLEKKMLRAEKKKFKSQLAQLHAIKTRLFPNDNLQERVDNFMPYYARYGPRFIEMLFEQSPDINQSFIIVSEKAESSA